MTAAAFTLVAMAATVARFAATRGLNRTGLPLGTFVVNVAGAFALGLVHDWSGAAMTIAGTALLGSLTTFSTVVGEAVDLAERDGPIRAAGYLALTTLVGFGAAAAGVALT